MVLQIEATGKLEYRTTKISLAWGNPFKIGGHYQVGFWKWIALIVAPIQLQVLPILKSDVTLHNCNNSNLNVPHWVCVHTTRKELPPLLLYLKRRGNTNKLKWVFDRNNIFHGEIYAIKRAATYWWPNISMPIHMPALKSRIIVLRLIFINQSFYYSKEEWGYLGFSKSMGLLDWDIRRSLAWHSLSYNYDTCLPGGVYSRAVKPWLHCIGREGTS